MSSAPISQIPSCQLKGSSGKAVSLLSAMSINKHFSKFTSSYIFSLFQILKNYVFHKNCIHDHFIELTQSNDQSMALHKLQKTVERHMVISCN